MLKVGNVQIVLSMGVAVMALISCGGDETAPTANSAPTANIAPTTDENPSSDESSPENETPDETNVKPAANAGEDQVVPVGTTVTLNGSSSTDSDNDNLSYQWSFSELPAESQAVLSTSTVFNPTFVADFAGNYSVSLVVNDGELDSEADTTRISATATNIAPLANAGNDQSVFTGTEVTLDGSQSTDANSDQLSYLWTLSLRPEDSGLALTDPTAVTQTFTPDVDGLYQFSLSVSDGDDQSQPDDVDVTSTTGNTAPIANAGQDQTGTTGSLFTLDGSGSSDADQDVLAYHWTLLSAPSGSASLILDANTAAASISTDVDGDYEVQLEVNDGQNNSVDSVLITSSENNSSPIANAGQSQEVITGSLVNLDGSESSDSNGDELTYAWILTSLPDSSSASLNGSTTVRPSFTPDIDGSYVIQLTVSDGVAVSPIDSVSIVSASSPSSLVDNFDGNNALLTTVNNAAALPDINTTGGRYRANLTNNSDNITLHFKLAQGRLDATLLNFPFEFVARNIGIGTQEDSQEAAPHSGSPYNFAGVQVHVLDLDDPTSSHVVVGHRGETGFTIEGKNTVSGTSVVDDIGEDRVPLGRADIRIVGNSDRTLTIYWQAPNLTYAVEQDEWILYGPGGTPDGRLPGNAPDYGESVYVGLITYAYGNTGVPFVGTCDRIEISQ